MAVRFNLFAVHSIFPFTEACFFESERSSVLAPFQYCLLTFNIFCFFFYFADKVALMKADLQGR